MGQSSCECFYSEWVGQLYCLHVQGHRKADVSGRPQFFVSKSGYYQMYDNVGGIMRCVQGHQDREVSGPFVIKIPF